MNNVTAGEKSESMLGDLLCISYFLSFMISICMATEQKQHEGKGKPFKFET